LIVEGDSLFKRSHKAAYAFVVKEGDVAVFADEADPRMEGKVMQRLIITIYGQYS